MLNPISSTLLVYAVTSMFKAGFIMLPLRQLIHLDQTHFKFSNTDHTFPQSSKEKSTKIIRHLGAITCTNRMFLNSIVHFTPPGKLCYFWCCHERFHVNMSSIFPFPFFKAQHVFFLGVRHVAAVL